MFTYHMNIAKNAPGYSAPAIIFLPTPMKTDISVALKLTEKCKNYEKICSQTMQA